MLIKIWLQTQGTRTYNVLHIKETPNIKFIQSTQVNECQIQNKTSDTKEALAAERERKMYSRKWKTNNNLAVL